MERTGSAARAVLLCFLSLPVVQSQDWGVQFVSTKICAPRGSTVDMNCTFTYPNSVSEVVQTFWFFQPGKEEDLTLNSDYAGRVQYLGDDSRSTLRITDLRDADSKTYKFRFITDNDKYTGRLGVTLHVTGLEMLVTRLQVSQSSTEAELMCRTSCTSDASYVWFKNGQKVPEKDSSNILIHLNPGDSISCALTGLEYYRTASLYAPKVPSVSSSGDIVEGSSVNLTCSTDANIVVNYTWFKNNQTVLLQGSQLVFISILSSDSGEYHCTAENELGTRTSQSVSVDVRYAPKLPSVSLSPSGQIVEGSPVTLTCSSDANPAANYTWYKEKQTVLQGAGGVHHFTSISSEDRGIYCCESDNQYGRINSTSLFLDVQCENKTSTHH